MRILCFRIRWFNSVNRRRRKVTSKPERLASAMLLKAALENPKTLAVIMNKFGQIQMNQDDEIENEIRDLQNKIHKKVAEALPKHHKRDLTYYIDTLINIILGTDNRSAAQLEEVRPAGTYTVRPGGISAIHRRRKPGEKAVRHTPSLSGLKALTVPTHLANQGIQLKGRDGSKKTRQIQPNGQWPEMDENQHQTYQQRQRIHNNMGHPPNRHTGRIRFPTSTNLYRRRRRKPKANF